MKIGIISDIHSNLEALQAILDSARKQHVDEYICLGDIVGYGANPNECIDIMRNLTGKFVAGNHDFGVCGLANIAHFNNAAIKAIEWTKTVMVPEHIAFLKSLPLLLNHNNKLFVHATPSYPDSWAYILSMNDAIREFGFFDNWLCFVGHSHQPVTFTINQEHKIGSSIDNSFACTEKKRYIINAGSVGQPRDGNPESSYVIFDTALNKITFFRIPYDIKMCQEKILNAGLPSFLAQRLEIGR